MRARSIQIFFNPAIKHVAAYVLQAEPERADSTGLIVDVAAVHALLADALRLSDDAALRRTATGVELNYSRRQATASRNRRPQASRQRRTNGRAW